MARVLLVDDVYTARSMVERVLARVGGYQVEAVGGGEEALAVAVARPPDVIILDISMAEMDGPTTLRELRARGVSCPVLAHTARTERFPGEFVAQGFDAYIPKTGNLGALLTTIRELVGA